MSTAMMGNGPSMMTSSGRSVPAVPLRAGEETDSNSYEQCRDNQDEFHFEFFLESHP